jgi:Clp amino terminal domain, pathogenicity island component
LFERYTERARRAIFFARYEASALGTMQITAEELLLGILREDKAIAMRLAAGAVESIRKELEQLAGPKRELSTRVSTSVDMLVGLETRRALELAAEEAENLQHKHIHTTHLMLGLLRVENSLAAGLLRKHGMTLERCREIAREDSLGIPVRERAVVLKRPHPALPETSLEPAICALRRLVDNTASRLRAYSDSYGDRRLSTKPWTRKEALGHLIDRAIAHQQCVAQAATESKIDVPGVPDEIAVAVQRYAEFPWLEAVDLWAALNRLIIHVLVRVPEGKLNVETRIGTAEPVALNKAMEAYVAHCEEIVSQILARPE